MPTIQGILETALYVEDVDRSRQFYQDLFGFDQMVADGRICSLRIPHGGGYQVLLLFKIGATLNDVHTPGGVIPRHDGKGDLHMAYQIAREDYQSWKGELEKRGITIESEVAFGEAKSLYFRDPDNHLIELATPDIWSEITKSFK